MTGPVTKLGEVSACLDPAESHGAQGGAQHGAYLAAEDE